MMMPLRPSAIAWLRHGVAALLVLVVPANAAGALGISEPQQAVAYYDEIALLPLPNGVGTLETDPVRGEVLYTHAGEPFGDAWLTVTERRVADASLLAGMEQVGDRALRLRLASLRSRVVVLALPFDDRGYLVIGHLRHAPDPRRYMLGEACRASFWLAESPLVREAIADYCDDDLSVSLASIELDSTVRSSERQVITVLRHVLEIERTGAGQERLQRLADGGVGADARYAAWTSIGFAAAQRNELPAALDAFAEAKLELRSASAERIEGCEAAIDAVGGGLYERLIRAAMRAEAPLAAVYYAERYGAWEDGSFDPLLKWDLARAYRLLDLSASAATLYVEVLSRGVEDEVTLLHELARAYLESGDVFRAIETVEFLREQYPRAVVDPSLENALASRLGRHGPSPDPCAEDTPATTGVAHLRRITCARQRGDMASAASHARAFQEWASTADDTLADPRLGALLEADAVHRSAVR